MNSKKKYDWQTTLAGVAIAGVGFLIYKGWLTESVGQMAMCMIAGYGFMQAADKRNSN